MAQTPPPSITPAPLPAPQRGDRATFSARVDAFVTWLTAAVAQFGAVATNVYANAVDAYNNAVIASAQANAATTAVDAAPWTSGAIYAVGDVRYSPVNLQSYRRRTAGAGTTDPYLDYANWTAISGSASILLATFDAAGAANVDIEGMFDTGYDTYEIVISGWRPTVNGEQIRARFKIGGAYLTTNTYASAVLNLAPGAAPANVGLASQSSALISNGVGGGGTGKYDGTVRIAMPAQSTMTHGIYFSGASMANPIADSGAANNSTLGLLTGIRLFASTGTIAAGKIRVYGLKNG